MNIGIDCGGVLLDNYNRTDGSMIPIKESFLELPMIDGALEALHALVEAFGQEHVVLVSRVSEEREAKLVEWIHGMGFVGEHGFLKENLYFCRERNDKADLAKKLGLTHFVDNRLEVLGCLPFVEHLYLFQPSQFEIDSYDGESPQVEYTAETWPKLVKVILK